MSSTDKTGDQLVASIRRTRQGVAGKDAVKTVPVTAKSPAAAAPVNTPKRPAAIARYPVRPRVWPD